MRSVHERPGELWPQDMVISVDQPNNLITLLFVCYAVLSVMPMMLRSSRLAVVGGLRLSA